MALINEEYNFIFIHIPKNAGTSCREALKHLDNTEIGGKHIPFDKIQAQEDIDPHDYFTFAFVRNPWDRVLSLFEFYKSGRHKRIILPKDADFNVWVALNFTNIIEDQEIFDQCRWVGNDINYVGKVENFNEDFAEICEKIKIPLIIPDKLNTTNHKHYHEYYSETSKDIIAHYFDNDIKRFKYTY